MEPKTYQIGKQKLTLAKTSPKQIAETKRLMGIESFGSFLKGQDSQMRESMTLLDIQCDQTRFNEFIRILTGYDGEPILLEEIESSEPILRLWSDFFIRATRSM